MKIKTKPNPINQLDAQGRQESKWRYFQSNGQLRWEGAYSQGRREGKWKEWKEGENIKTERKVKDESATAR